MSGKIKPMWLRVSEQASRIPRPCYLLLCCKKNKSTLFSFSSSCHWSFPKFVSCQVRTWNRQKSTPKFVPPSHTLVMCLVFSVAPFIISISPTNHEMSLPAKSNQSAWKVEISNLGTGKIMIPQGKTNTQKSKFKLGHHIFHWVLVWPT